MITALVQFKIPTPMSQEKATQVFAGTAPKYQEARGLIRKYYLLSEDGRTVGGVYLWKSRKDAEGLYTNEWKSFVKEKYGGEPSIVYFYSPGCRRQFNERDYQGLIAGAGVSAAGSVHR